VSGANELARVEARPVVRAVMPQGLGELWKFAEAAAKSRLYGVTTTEAAFMVLQTGMELGLMPTQALRGIYIVQNRPMLSADLCVAIVQSDARCDYWRTIESTPVSCTIETRRKGSPEPTRKTWTEADAKRADLYGKGTWKQYPAQMLRHRCAMDLAREVYSDLLLGLYTPAEFDDTREMRAEHVEVQGAEPMALQPSGFSIEAAAITFCNGQDNGQDAETLMDRFEALHRGLPPGTSKAALKRAIAAEAERRKAVPVESIPVAMPVTGKDAGEPAPANDASRSAPVELSHRPGGVFQPHDPDTDIGADALEAYSVQLDGAADPDAVVAVWREHHPALRAAGAIDAAKRLAVQAVAAMRGKGEMDATNWLKSQLNPGDGPKPRGRKPAPVTPPVDAEGSGEHAVAPEGTVAWLERHLMRHRETYAIGASWAKNRHAFPRALWAEARGVVIDRMLACGADPQTVSACLDGVVEDFDARQAARAKAAVAMRRAS
jgi:hypothetical protein